MRLANRLTQVEFSSPTETHGDPYIYSPPPTALPPPGAWPTPSSVSVRWRKPCSSTRRPAPACSSWPTRALQAVSLPNWSPTTALLCSDLNAEMSRNRRPAWLDPPAHRVCQLVPQGATRPGRAWRPHSRGRLRSRRPALARPHCSHLAQLAHPCPLQTVAPRVRGLTITHQPSSGEHLPGG